MVAVFDVKRIFYHSTSMLMKNIVINKDCLTGLKELQDNSIDCCITSPPYWALRNYGTSQIYGGNEFCEHIEFENNYCVDCGAWQGELGLEERPMLYIEHLMSIFKEIKRVLKDDATLFVNIDDTYSSGNRAKGGGDKYAFDPKNKNVNRETYAPNRMGCGIPDKSLCLIPELFVIEMARLGFIVRNKVIWHKPNQMPESAKDRFTNDFEMIYFFTKSKSYYFNQQKEGNRNKRSVWSINTKPFSKAHFAVYPEQLVKIMINSGCPENGIVLDPFMGSGTTAVVAKKLNRNFIGFELNPDYVKIINERIYDELGMFQ